MTTFKSSSPHQILMARSVPHGKGSLRTCRRSVVDKRVGGRHAAAAASSVTLLGCALGFWKLPYLDIEVLSRGGAVLFL